MSDNKDKKSAGQKSEYKDNRKSQTGTVKKTTKSKTKAEKSVYQPGTIDLGSDLDTKVAYDELHAYEALQYKFDSTLMNYKTWANENVHYAGLNSLQMQQKLKQCNDSYTMATICDMMTPLREGITFSSLIQLWSTTKMVRMANPSFDMDVARLTSNLRAELIDRLSPWAEKHGSFGKSVLESVSKGAAATSVNKFGSEVERNVQQHTLDDVVMTPRQIAALKLNFMEQCYSDMRSTTKSSNVDKYYEAYTDAVENLNKIALNSGFSMSVVAAEERYLVGLKMEENPAYANVFAETADLGSRPYGTQAEGSIFWDGRFRTSDGNDYTVTDNGLGAFTPRKPLDDENTLRETLVRRGKLFAAAAQYLQSDDCNASHRVKQQAKAELDTYMSDYKNLMMSMIRDDGMGDRHSCKKIWQESFAKSYEDSLKQFESGKYDTAYKNPAMRSKNDEMETIYTAFRKEVNHSVNKDELNEAFKGTGLVVGEGSDSDILQARDVLKKFADKKAAEYAKSTGQTSTTAFVDSRTGKQILDDMRINKMKSLNGDAAMRLMLRAVTNMEQGYKERSDYYRESDKCFDNERVKYDIPVTKTSSGKSREVPDFDNHDDKDRQHQPV